MKYRCFLNGKLITNIFHEDKEINKVYRNGTLIWQKEDSVSEGELTIYAKDGAVVKYKASEISGIGYYDIRTGETKTNCLTYLAIGSTGFLVNVPYCYNEHLSNFEMHLEIPGESDFGVNSLLLSVIDDTSCLYTIPSYSFGWCKDLKYIKSNSVTCIGNMSFVMGAL